MAEQCTATARTGDRCRRPAVDGATVCRFHGGAAPQVRAAAERRKLARELERITLAELGEPARVDDPFDAYERLFARRVELERAAWAKVELLRDEEYREAMGFTESHLAEAERRYGEESDRLERLMTARLRLELDAKIAGREMSLSEAQGQAIGETILGILGDLDLAPAERAKAPAVVREWMTRLKVGGPMPPPRRSLPAVARPVGPVVPPVPPCEPTPPAEPRPATVVLPAVPEPEVAVQREVPLIEVRAVVGRPAVRKRRQGDMVMPRAGESFAELRARQRDAEGRQPWE